MNAKQEQALQTARQAITEAILAFCRGHEEAQDVAYEEIDSLISGMERATVRVEAS